MVLMTDAVYVADMSTHASLLRARSHNATMPSETQRECENCTVRKLWKTCAMNQIVGHRAVEQNTGNFRPAMLPTAAAVHSRRQAAAHRQQRYTPNIGVVGLRRVDWRQRRDEGAGALLAASRCLAIGHGGECESDLTTNTPHKAE